MNKTPDKEKPKTRKGKLRKALKVKFSKVTILAGFVTGILVCLCILSFCLILLTSKFKHFLCKI